MQRVLHVVVPGRIDVPLSCRARSNMPSRASSSKTAAALRWREKLRRGVAEAHRSGYPWQPGDVLHVTVTVKGDESKLVPVVTEVWGALGLRLRGALITQWTVNNAPLAVGDDALPANGGVEVQVWL